MSNDTDGRETTKSLRLTEHAHGRLSEHCRAGETMSGAVERALDALEREERLLDAVEADLRGGE